MNSVLHSSGQSCLCEICEKDRWIQKAKALLFDCQFCVDAKSIVTEINQLLTEGGGYDYRVESSKTTLRWKGNQP